MRLSFTLDVDIQTEKILKGAKTVLWLSMNKMQKLAKIKAPVDTALLRRSINLNPIIEGALEYLLSTGVNYGEAVEFGTDPHIITAKNKQALSFEWTNVGGKLLSKKARRSLQAARGSTISGDKVVFRSVMHPGTNAQPFFRPALLEVENKWVSIFWAQVFKQ